ncbi:MAG: hypothetical protein ABEJ40_01400 [Haloarculaceae archaeon]
MTTARHLVVVAGAGPSMTDALADALRDTCTVRTAYDVAEVVDRLDGEVDVVLVSPDLSPDAADAVVDAVESRELDCQVALLAEDRNRGPSAPRIDAVVAPSTPRAHVCETVEWLATRASYRKALEEYYELARTYADARPTELNVEASDDGVNGDPDPDPTGDPGPDRTGDPDRGGSDGAEETDRSAELERIEAQLERLRERLDETHDRLDTLSLFEAALDRPED